MRLDGASARALPIAVYTGFASLLLAAIAFNFVDIDLWHQMGLVRASLAAGHLLTKDVFAYTPTVDPVIDHEWGAGVLAFFLGRWMGGAGILLMKFTAAFGTLFLAVGLARRRGAPAGVMGFLALPFIGLLYLGFLPVVRAHAYTFLFTACLLWVLELDRRGKGRWLWVWLVVFPLWVNLHAGFVVGMGFVFLYLVEQALFGKLTRRVVLVWLGMGVEVFLNPYGARYVEYLARALTMARPRIPEWGPVWTLGWSGGVWFAIAVGVVGYAITESGTWRVPGGLLLGASAIEGLLHRKLLPLFAITWLCYGAAYFQKTAVGGWLDRFAQRRGRFLLLVWIVTVSVGVMAAVRQKFWQVEVPQVEGEASYPVGAVDYLAAHEFRGNVMVPFRSGAYVSWKLYPAVKVSVDSRYEVAYPDEWVERSFRFYEAGEGWRETLDAYPTDVVLVPKTAAVRNLIGQEGWKRVYVDAEFELYARPGVELPAVDRSGEVLRGVFP